MSQDNFGNLIYPGSIDNGAIDTEHSPILYPTKSERICAQDERFASVDEAIGLLQYGQQQTDDLADERHNDHERRIAALEAAQPVPSSGPRVLTSEYLQGYADGKASATHIEGDYAHIPAAIWDDICAELEELRKFKASVPWGEMFSACAHAEGSAGGEWFDDLQQWFSRTDFYMDLE